MIRIFLVAALFVATFGFWWLAGRQHEETAMVAGGSRPVERGTLPDPYSHPHLSGYRAYRNALATADHLQLEALAFADDTFLAYRSAMTLARLAELDPRARLRYYLRAVELRIDDPLARQDNREFQLGLGALAEAAGDKETAVLAYGKALPHAAAKAGLARLENDPYKLSNLYFKARMSREALEALGGLGAPSIEAPSLERLGEYQKALEAYERWLAQVPGSFEARYGIAWMNYYLGHFERAKEQFSRLEGSGSIYGRALIERRQGNLERAVELVESTGEARRLWAASSWLEAEDRYRDALRIYLQLARHASSYSDDAAYRAIVLARRLGDDAAQEEARSLLPQGSFFALLLGEAPILPELAELPQVRLEVQELAAELARVDDLEAAVGELVFALRKAQDEATAVSLAETLQAFGEFRQSQRAAQKFVDAGSRELRTWMAAYPRAYPDIVEAEAARNRLEPELVWAVMRQESAFYPAAVSTSNAIGLMQVIPSTWDWLAELQREQPGDAFDPAANIRYGSYYLRWLMNYLNGDTELVIASYNRGQGYIRRLYEGPVVAGDKDEFYREIDAFETREYLQRVTVNYRTYLALYGSEELALSNP